MEKVVKIFRKRGVAKGIAFVTVLVVLALLSRRYGWDLFDPNMVGKMQTLAKDDLLMASLIYVIATIVGCVVLALPGVSFAIVAGAVFGPWIGTVLCTLAATIGALGSFLAGRYFLKDAIEPLIRKNKPLEKLLLSGSEKNAMVLLMITRLLPIFPYNLQNFAYGITNISALSFTIYSMIFLLPGTAMFTLGTAGLADAENRTLYFALAIFLAVFVFGSSYLLKKYMDKKETGWITKK